MLFNRCPVEKQKRVKNSLLKKRMEKTYSSVLTGKTGGIVKRKAGGQIGTGAALRGFGKGYKT